MKTFSALLRAATPILVMVIPVLGQAPIVSGIVNGAGGSTFSPGTLGLVIGRDFVPAPVNCATATAWVEWCSGLGIGITDANGKKAQAAIGAVTPTQITFQVPVDLALGQAIAIVIRNVGSQFFGAEMRALNLEAYSPGLSIRNDAGKTIGAFLDNVSGPILTSKPVNPGDLASVLGFGLGPTNPAVRPARCQPCRLTRRRNRSCGLDGSARQSDTLSMSPGRSGPTRLVFAFRRPLQEAISPSNWKSVGRRATWFCCLFRVHRVLASQP